MKSALLFYNFLCNITNIGFRIKPYDPFVAKKVFKGIKMTVVWHIDDIKVSH